MAGHHHLHQHVEVSDDGRTVAAARAWSTRYWTFPRCGKARLEAAFPLGDGESLQRLQQRCQDVTTRQAGFSALLDASLPSGGPGARGRS